MTAPKHSLQRKLVNGLRYLLKEELKLNQPEASDGWLTDDALWLVSKTVSDKLRAHLLSQGVDGIPANNTAVFNVLQDHGMLQPTPDGKAIWRATITSSTGWSHSFTLLRLAPALIWEADERPASFAGTVVIDAATSEDKEANASDGHPTENTTPPSKKQGAPQWESGSTAPIPSSKIQAVPDVMEDVLAMVGADDLPATRQAAQAISGEVLAARAQASAPTSAAAPPSSPIPVLSSLATQPSGEHFMAWLQQGIASRRLIINDAKALVHTVSDAAYLVSPGVFQRYAQEHPQVGMLAKQDSQQGWQWVQKRFERLQQHRKHPNGRNIWACEVTGPRRSRHLHGYLLDDARLLFAETPPNNPYLSLARD